MPTFNKLFELLPNAEHLLSLEPEELAGPLLLSLLSLNGTQSMRPEGIISFSAMSSVLKNMSDSKKKDLDLNYPTECYDDVVFALMEAWQCLVCGGLAATNPTSLTTSRSAGTIGEYFVTRRGKKINTLEDFEAYRKTNLLPTQQLHSVIAQKVQSLFLRGDYDTAVFQAFKEVEIAVRKAGHYNDTDIGVALMRKAFNVDDGNLTAPNQQSAEKQARSDLFAGAIGSYKSPGSHRDVEITAEEAAEVIILASHLLRIVDSCNPSETN